MFVASTYTKIICHVAATALKSATLRFDAEVVNIEQIDAESETHNGVIVETVRGTREVFDEVIVTTPLGWLKRNKGAFLPRLPPRLSSAIDSIGYGCLEKVFITFPAAFWNIPGGSHCQGKPTQFPIETLFLEPRYADNTNPERWIQEMLSLASLPPPYSHPTVMFYVYGACGAHVKRFVLDLIKDSEEYYKALEAFFRPYYSNLPNYDASSANCAPRGFLMSDWQSDRFAGNGSYPDYQVGLEDGDRDVEVLRKGMGMERGVWFAGDHTAPFVGLGTVAGAYWSGEWVAGEIGKVYGMCLRTGVDIDDDPAKHTLRGNPDP